MLHVLVEQPSAQAAEPVDWAALFRELRELCRGT